jgi:diguanylate cyclase (GGDEF)-like protein
MNATPKEVYASALPETLFNAILQNIEHTYGVSLETIKSNQHIYLANVLNTQGKREQMAIKYDPRYELWTLSQIDSQQIFDDFMESFYLFIFIFAVANTILFFLFKIIANAEKQRRNDLIYQATHDDLTKLPNRNYLKQTIHHWIYEGAPPFSLYYLDMDHFKSINDSFGHQYGDLLLIEFARRLVRMVRTDSVVIRHGGDEFLILTYRTDRDEILEHAQRILNEISAAYHVHQLSFTVGASIGIAKYPEHGTTLDMLLRAADIAMYEAKKHKNSVRFFAPTMQEGYLNRVNLEHALRQALDHKEFFMVYQPQLDAEGNVYGVEALVRWNHPTMGSIPPNEFIPIAEATGLMPRLGYFILTRTLEEMKTLQEELGISFQTSINISVKQFMEIHFLEKLFHEIEHRAIKNIALCLEITESLFIEDIDYILPLLQQVHAMGIHISMDDFGTGYSSLSILRKLPIDELKIDKSFIDTLLNDVTAQKMTQNIITIGKNLELFILAEGVETQEQATLLKTFGCDRFQGFLYAKPMPYDALKAFFAAHFQKH